MKYTSEVGIAVHKDTFSALRIALSKLSSPYIPRSKPDQVIIKPSIYDPNLVGNTSARVVSSIVRIFGDLGDPLIVESNNPRRTAEQAFSECGYDALAKQKGRLVNLSNEPLIPTRFAGNAFDMHPMPQVLARPHILINAPTLKLEPEVCTAGGGLKNLFGLIPESDKPKYHDIIDDVLLDLLQAFRPDLTIMDLSEVVIGDRSDGRIIPVGGLVVGHDPVAVDAFCVSLLGINPLEVDYIRRAYDLSLGEALTDRIRILGTEHQKEKLFHAFSESVRIHK